jgi:XapX domain-containing protein
MNLSLVIVATMTGVATGVLFGLLDVPIPAPPNLAGVMGILGILVGYRLIEYFDVGVSLLSLLKV